MKLSPRQKRTAALALFALAVWAGNRAWTPRPPGQPTLLAHRGLAQEYDRTGLTGDTCTAARMVPPTHGYLENTLDSMQAAFALGARRVELDVHPTTDGHLCREHPCLGGLAQVRAQAGLPPPGRALRGPSRREGPPLRRVGTSTRG
jgi:hypothetical protein